MKKLFLLMAISAMFLASCQKDQPVFEQLANEETQNTLPADFHVFEGKKETHEALLSLRNDAAASIEKAGPTQLFDIYKILPKVGDSFYYGYMNQGNGHNYGAIKVTYAKFTGTHVGIIASDQGGHRKVTMILSLNQLNINTPSCVNTSGYIWSAQQYLVNESWASVQFTGWQANPAIGGWYDSTAPYTCTVGYNNIIGSQSNIDCKSVVARTSDDRSAWFSWPDSYPD